MLYPFTQSQLRYVSEGKTMKVKVAEVSRTDQNMGLLLESIRVDSELDVFGQSTFSSEIHIEEQYAFEEAKNRTQRIFQARNAEDGSSVAICFAYPVLLEGVMDPKIALMMRRPNPAMAPYFRPAEALKVDLRIARAENRGRGIGFGFATRVASKYLFTPESPHRQAVCLVDREDDKAVAFATSMHGRILSDLRGRLLFLFDF